MTEAERWVTRDEVLAACRRFEAAIPGWTCPALFGLGARRPDGTVWFPYVCRGDHPLPAVVLAAVCGHRGGTARYELTSNDLDRAIARLAPAGACREFDHPNLAAWRALRAWSATSAPATFVAVFDVAPHRPTDDPDVLALRRGRRSPWRGLRSNERSASTTIDSS